MGLDLSGAAEVGVPVPVAGYLVSTNQAPNPSPKCFSPAMRAPKARILAPDLEIEPPPHIVIN